MQNEKQTPDRLVLKLLAMAAAMFGFAVVAMPPLYDAFCEATGLGGRTNSSAADVTSDVVIGRDVKLEFVTTVNEYAKWDFDASVAGMTVNPGEMYEAAFLARNLSDSRKVAQAIPSVSPPAAAKYFRKLDCFCFSTQEFAADEQRELMVRFIIGSDLPEHIDTITLSYTFFDTEKLSQRADAPTTTSQ